MSEPQFFDRPNGMTVGEIASLTGAEPLAGADVTRSISNIAPIVAAHHERYDGTGYPARLAGDEFVILLPNILHRRDAEGIAL